MDDEVTTTTPVPPRDTDAIEPEDHARSLRPLSAEEVAKELISFLSQLSPFRIRSYRADR